MTHPDIELRHLRYFVAVAEDLSFTRAAERINLAQPALSQQIRQLEDRIGARLFHRAPRVALTVAGAAFLVGARRVLADVQHAAETAARAAAAKPSTLRIGFASSAALTPFPTIVRQFAAIRRDMSVRLCEMHSAEQVDALRRGAIDVAVLREPILDSEITSDEFFREPFVLVLPSRHRLLRHRSPLARCAEYPFIIFPRRVAPMLYDQIQTICLEAGFIPRVEHEAFEWHTIIALVAAGLGIAIAPASVAALHLSLTVLRPLPSAAGRAVLFLCYDQASSVAHVRDFARFARRAMRQKGSA